MLESGGWGVVVLNIGGKSLTPVPVTKYDLILCKNPDDASEEIEIIIR